MYAIDVAFVATTIYLLSLTVILIIIINVNDPGFLAYNSKLYIHVK